MENLLATALEAGLGAVALIALILLALRQQKDHKGERVEWRASNDRQFESITTLAERNAEVMANQTSAFDELKDVVKSCHERHDT